MPQFRKTLPSHLPQSKTAPCPVPCQEPTLTHTRDMLGAQVVVCTHLDPFLSLKALASYSGISVRKLRASLVDPVHPLPAYRVGGKILVRRSEFDAWMAAYRRVGAVDVEGIVEDVLHELS
jgi:excisionase family DNA binding protein